MKILVSPHNDDESLFAAFTILREKPLVLVVFDSYVQPALGIPGTDAETRRNETRAACEILGVQCEFLGFRDDGTPGPMHVKRLIQQHNPTQVWCPAYEEGGHDHHNLVAHACNGLPGVEERYLTYRRGFGKSTSARKVAYEPEWVGLKLRALACYRSQWHPQTGCAPHFIDSCLSEFYQ